METNSKPMTVNEILEDVNKMLGDINVPVSQIEQIGIPIAKAINGISICLDAFNKEAEKQAQQDEPEIKIVPVEENEDNA